MKRTVYLDNAATTATDPYIIEAMLPYFSKYYGNPSAVYDFADLSSTAIDNAKIKIAKLINSDYERIFFTSGGSESNNWVLRNCVNPSDHIITSKIEHHSVLNTCKYLEKNGVEVTYVDVDSFGRVNPNDITNAIKDNTKLISVMFANNEIGTIEPIKEIGEIAREHGILFHTDAVQAFGHTTIDVEDMYIDFLSSSAHKLNGPKGVGFLYIRDGIEIPPLIYGGHQQNGFRAGTENVPGIVGYGVAAEISGEEMDVRNKKCKRLVSYLKENLIKEIPNIIVNTPDMSLSNNLNVSFNNVRGEALLRLLEMYGIYVSTGSACNSSSGDPSHVLLAIGRTSEEANSSIRFSLSHETSKDDIDYVIKTLITVVQQLRAVNRNE